MARDYTNQDLNTLNRRLAKLERIESRADIFISGTPVAGEVAQWTNQDTLETAGYPGSAVARYSGSPVAGNVATWSAAGTVQDGGYPGSAVARYSGVPTAGRLAQWAANGTIETASVSASNFLVYGGALSGTPQLLAYGSGGTVYTTSYYYNQVVTTVNPPALVNDWDIGSARYIAADKLRARSAAGLRLEDDAGNVGVFVEDGGHVSIGHASPEAALHILGSGVAGRRFIIEGNDVGGGAPQFSLKDTSSGDSWNLQYVKSAGYLRIRLDPADIEAINILDANGNVGFGVTDPQGRIHAHDGTSGKLFGTWTGVNNIAQTVIPNGTGDVTKHMTGKYIVDDNAGNVIAGDIDVANDSFQNLVIDGSNEVRIAVYSSGWVEVFRGLGTRTYTVTLDVIWQ